MKNIFDITDKVIVYTGATGVLGNTIVKYLAANGAILCLIGRNPEKGEELATEVTSAGHKATFFRADVLEQDTLQEICDTIISKYGRIDILINSAGGNMPGATIPPDKTLFDVDVQALRTVVDINLFGTIIPTMVFAKAMNGEGVVLNFSSESSLRPLTRVFGYGAAKAAINNITQYLATELASKFGEKMRVNAIAPGFFLTNQNRALLLNADGSYSDRSNKILTHTPFGRFGEPDDLCGTIHYLISDASKFVTGTVAVVDGGFNAFSI